MQTGCLWQPETGSGMNALERAVALITRFLEERRVPYMLIGGIANLVWGEPRSTLVSNW